MLICGEKNYIKKLLQNSRILKRFFYLGNGISPTFISKCIYSIRGGHRSLFPLWRDEFSNLRQVVSVQTFQWLGWPVPACSRSPECQVGCEPSPGCAALPRGQSPGHRAAGSDATKPAAFPAAKGEPGAPLSAQLLLTPSAARHPSNKQIKEGTQVTPEQGWNCCDPQHRALSCSCLPLLAQEGGMNAWAPAHLPTCTCAACSGTQHITGQQDPLFTELSCKKQEILFTVVA